VAIDPLTVSTPTNRVNCAMSSHASPTIRQRAIRTEPLHSQDGEATPTLNNVRIRSHVVSEVLFTSVLVREMRRSERSNLPSAVVIVAMKPTIDKPLVWRPVIDALNASKRETDVIGWLKKDVAVGAVLPELRASCADLVQAFEARLRRELAKRLRAEVLVSLSIRFHVNPAACREQVGDLPIDPLPMDVRPRPEHVAAYDAVKRGVDIVGSGVLVIALLPVFLVIAVLVKLTSPGPVFFRQLRIGHRGKTFTMLKFRTMRANADHAMHQKFVTDFIKSNASGQQGRSGKDVPFKIKNDPRVTSIGRILRKTSLDELPQLWNVLVGEMSLVGPRPPIAYEVEQYKFWHSRRLFEAKPGVTGLWQVKGRSRTTFDEMVRLDLQYARSSSLWTDLKILLATPAAVFTGKGAC
jgi:exopolysaccharide biosynthesis polyprenyl glycosylphosphotransferase